jgi:hypothetical protein
MADKEKEPKPAPHRSETSQTCILPFLIYPDLDTGSFPCYKFRRERILKKHELQIFFVIAVWVSVVDPDPHDPHIF